jgi:hypothetical protein
LHPVALISRPTGLSAPAPVQSVLSHPAANQATVRIAKAHTVEFFISDLLAQGLIHLDTTEPGDDPT